VSNVPPPSYITPGGAAGFGFGSNSALDFPELLYLIQIVDCCLPAARTAVANAGRSAPCRGRACDCCKGHILCVHPPHDPAGWRGKVLRRTGFALVWRRGDRGQSSTRVLGRVYWQDPLCIAAAWSPAGRRCHDDRSGFSQGRHSIRRRLGCRQLAAGLMAALLNWSGRAGGDLCYAWGSKFFTRGMLSIPRADRLIGRLRSYDTGRRDASVWGTRRVMVQVRRLCTCPTR